MIKNYLLDGIFEEKETVGFDRACDVVETNRRVLWRMPIKAIIAIFDELGRKVAGEKDLHSREGVNFLCLWLRRSNLQKLVELNINRSGYLDSFVPVSGGIRLLAQPRGIVCHWVAGNVPTLALISLVQSVLAKNGNIVKISPETEDIVLGVLKQMDGIGIDLDGKKYYGKDILRSIAVVSFPGEDRSLNESFSKIADCKVMWGGEQAVQSIVSLPQKEHCETIVFGPKYSFSVFDREFTGCDDLFNGLKKTVLDIIAFDQMACSSPHVIFFEKSDLTMKEVAGRLAEAFNVITGKYPKRSVDPSVATDIINKRGEYYLDPEKDIIASEGCDWTILIDKRLCLEEPVRSRTIFVKQVDSIMDVLDLVTKKVQTVGMCVKNKEKKYDLCSELTYRGVARCVNAGSMNYFDSPWDGMFFINRLVRWVSIKE